MSVEPGEIPLLPVPAVLFPGTFLPMQVSAETDRSLFRDCVDANYRIGVVSTLGDSDSFRSTIPCTTGCMASVALLSRLRNAADEEPFDVVLYGEERIRILDFVQQDPYLTGHFELLQEYGGPHAEQRTQQAEQLLQQYLHLIQLQYDTEIINISLPSDPTMASYLLASLLFSPLELKQRWLESLSTTLRLEEELSFLQTECDKHQTLLALSTYMNQRYTVTDARRYIALTSVN